MYRADLDDDLPAALVAIKLLGGVGVHRMLALGDVHALVLAAERGGEVALAGVVDDGDDGRELGMGAGELERGGHVAPAGDAAEDAFLGGQAAGGLDALLGGGGDDAGELGDVEVARDEAVADALDAVVPPLAPGEERALGGLHRVEPHRGVLAAEVAAHAGDEAAGAL